MDSGGAHRVREDCVALTPMSVTMLSASIQNTHSCPASKLDSTASILLHDGGLEPAQNGHPVQTSVISVKALHPAYVRHNICHGLIGTRAHHQPIH